MIYIFLGCFIAFVISLIVVWSSKNVFYMIEFIKDVDLGEGVIIKKGMIADYYPHPTIPRIGFSLFTHPEWNEYLKLPLGAAAIYDLNDFPEDSYIFKKIV